MNRDLRALGRELRTSVRPSRPWLPLAGWFRRRIPEIVALAILARCVWRSLEHVGPIRTAILAAILVAGLLVFPPTRRALAAMFWARVTRHRLRTGLLELRLTTHRGKPPLKLLIRPTAVGERVWLWLRAGVSAEDLADASEHLRAACWARDVRVTRGQRWSHIATVDVVRRDPLAARRVITAPLAMRVINGKGRHVPTR